MPKNLTPALCNGACCRNPFGVCYCERDCTYHEAEKAKREKARENQAWVAEMTRAGSVAGHKPTMRNVRR